MKVPADQLKKALGITDVDYLVSGKSLALVDSPLDSSMSASSGEWTKTIGLVILDEILEGTNYATVEKKQFANLKWRVAVLIAIASVVISVGTVSQAQHSNGSGRLGSTAAGTDAAPPVMIDHFAFSPVPLTINVGTTVT
jgi:hypothetical protein